MEYRTLIYLEQGQGIMQYNSIINNVGGDYEKLPNFFRNLIKGVRAIKDNKIPTNEIYENYFEFPTSPNLTNEVKNYVTEIISSCSYDEVMDHSEFGANILQYIEYIIKGTYSKL